QLQLLLPGSPAGESGHQAGLRAERHGWHPPLLSTGRYGPCGAVAPRQTARPCACGTLAGSSIMRPMTMELELEGNALRLEEVERVARAGDVQVSISADARSRVRAARELVERAAAENRVVYGITTGFG